MTRPELPQQGRKRMIAFSIWLYSLCLRAYPADFRRAYGTRMSQVFRDSCRAALQEQGRVAIMLFWLHTLTDLASSACLERWQYMQKGFLAMTNARLLSPRLWIALIATMIAFMVSLVASLNLYLLEDGNALTQAAYSASSVLRFSYDGVYLSALAAGVAMCAIVGYALMQRALLVMSALGVLALLVAFGGFGGLLVRHGATFFVFLLIFLALTLLSLLVGRGVAARATNTSSQRAAAILGACVGVGSLLLINVGALILHTLLLNPVSHALYMQGEITGTHFNFSLLAMVVALLTLLACLISLGLALRGPSHLRQA